MANSKFVSRAECTAAMKEVSADLDLVKTALIGNDMRGGMVNDVAQLNMKVDSLVKQSQLNKEIGLKWKLAIFGALASAVISIVGWIIASA